MTNSPAKPLSGLRVLDMGAYITAPYAAMLLGELGADVIKIERPGVEDPFRSHTGEPIAPFFFAFNRNKRALSLDYTTPDGHDVLLELIRSADVLLVNVRPGVEARLRIAPDALHAVNERLIYCSITGFGADGPYSKRPAYDTVGQAASGLLSRYHQHADPRIVGPAMSDSLTGMQACIGILAALQERTRTGRGRLVEVNMLESALAFAIEPLAHVLFKGVDQPYYYRGASSQAYILECRDGLRIGLHMSSPDKFWNSLAQAISRPDLASRFPTSGARLQAYDEIAVTLDEVFRQRDRADWIELLEAHDVPFAPERRLDEVMDDAQVRHLGAFTPVDPATYGAALAPNRAIRLDGDNRSTFRPPPAIGQHTDEILRELGIDDEAIERLRSGRVVR